MTVQIMEDRLILPNAKGNLYRRSDVWTESWRMNMIFLSRDEKIRKGGVKAGMHVV